MEWLTDPQVWIALVTLTALEIILGVDNIIFISILAGKLPENRQSRARVAGLALAMLTRIALLFSITWIMKLTEPSFSVFGKDFSGRDLILIAGGLFLLGKSTFDIHEKLEGKVDTNPRKKIKISFTNVIIQIMLLDIVFSLDSVITAVGMTTMLGVMVTAVIIAVIFMMFSSGAISRFVHRHPTIKILALSFLLLIGIMLIADGLGQHISKGYIYFAMAFSLFVETLNMKMRKRRLKPVELYESYLEKTEKRFVKG